MKQDEIELGIYLYTEKGNHRIFYFIFYYFTVVKIQSVFFQILTEISCGLYDFFPEKAE